MVVRPTPWGRGKSSWGPWNGLVRGMLVSFRREINENGFLLILEDSDDSECVVGRSLAT